MFNRIKKYYYFITELLYVKFYVENYGHLTKQIIKAHGIAWVFCIIRAVFDKVINTWKSQLAERHAK